MTVRSDDSTSIIAVVWINSVGRDSGIFASSFQNALAVLGRALHPREPRCGLAGMESADRLGAFQ